MFGFSDLKGATITTVTHEGIVDCQREVPATPQRLPAYVLTIQRACSINMLPIQSANSFPLY